ncbi:MAG TPA: hypothetical protein VE710_11895 [Candidatus Bathyarchaeia archaeon]|nr:hypothetical protein [Candidatus Bathyarchaeia archaeon]
MSYQKYFAKRAVIHTLTLIILSLIISQIGKTLYPDWYIILFTDYTWWIIFIVASYLGYKKYRDLCDLSNRWDFIYNLKQEEMSYAKLEKLAVSTGIRREAIDKKIDILKSLSPIPLLLFIAGIYINNQNILSKEILIFSKKLLLGDILMYLGIGTPVVYLYFLFASYKAYENISYQLSEYKGESIVMKEIYSNNKDKKQ